MEITVGKCYIAESHCFVEQIQCEKSSKCDKYIQIWLCSWVDKYFSVACASSIFQESFWHFIYYVSKNVSPSKTTKLN